MSNLNNKDEEHEDKLPTLGSKIEAMSEMQNTLLEDDDTMTLRNRKYKNSRVNIFFSAVYLVFLLLTLLFSSIVLFSNGSAERLSPTIETEYLVPKANQRLYTIFNGLRVSFISSNDTMTSAIALVIQAGIGDEEFKGIARLTHMILTNKLKLSPLFISVNSTITHDRTYYSIEVNDQRDILESLETMTNIIAKPMIEDKDIEIAIKKMRYDYEYSLMENDREVIENELLYHYYNDNGKNDKSQFKKLLVGEDIEKTKEEIQKYIETSYYAHKMSIAIVINSNELDNTNAKANANKNTNSMLKEKVFDILSHYRISDSLDEEEEMNDLIDNIADYSSSQFTYKSTKDSISIYYLNTTFNKQFSNYFQYTINTYGNFYLFNENEEYIQSIEPFHIKVRSMHEALGLRVSLTNKAIGKLDDIRRGLLAFVSKICSDLEKDLGLPEGYREIKRINEKKSLFNEKTYSSTQLASDFANRLLIKDDVDVHKNKLQNLPSVAIIGDNQCQCINGFDMNDYQSEIGNDELIRTNKKNEQNSYITQSCNREQYIKEDINKAIIESSGIIVHQRDMKIDYYLPKSLVLLEVIPNVDWNDKTNAYYSMLAYLSHLKVNIKRHLSEAIAAGNDIDLQTNDYKSIQLSILGYNDKIGLITKEVLNELCNYSTALSQLNNKTVWDIILKDQYSTLPVKADDYFSYHIGGRDIDVHSTNHSLFNSTIISEALSTLSKDNSLILQLKGIVYGNAIISEDIFKILQKQRATKPILNMKKELNVDKHKVTLKRLTNSNPIQSNHLTSYYYALGKALIEKDSIMSFIITEFLKERINTIDIGNDVSFFIKQIIVNDTIWLNLAMESFNKTINAITLFTELNKAIEHFKTDMNNSTLLTDDLIERYQQRYSSHKYNEDHTIAYQAYNELKNLNSKSISIEASNDPITSNDLSTLFNQRLFINTYLLIIQLFPHDYQIPKWTNEKYQLNKDITIDII